MLAILSSRNERCAWWGSSSIEKCPGTLPPSHPCRPWKTHVMRNPFPGIIIESRHIKSQMVSSCGTDQSQTQPSCPGMSLTFSVALTRSLTSLGPGFLFAKWTSCHPDSCLRFFFSPFNILFLWRLWKLILLKPTFKKLNQYYHPVSNQLTDVKRHDLERQLVNN